VVPHKRTDRLAHAIAAFAADADVRRAYGERSRAIVSGYSIESAADGIVAACTTEERRPAWKREASTARG